MTNIAATGPCCASAARRDILGVEVCDVARGEALAMLHADLLANTHRRVAFLNAHSANIAATDPQFRKTLERFVVLSDGIGVDLAALLLYGRHFLANLNGTDFVPELLLGAPQPLKVGLFGAAPNVAERAAAGFAAIDPRHDYRALSHGYVGADERQEALDLLTDWKPDILLVALGVPAQENWIAEHIAPSHCTLAIGVGALFDFVAGTVPRAPGWVRRTRMEWIYRLLLEPRRLWRRYLLGNPVFLARVIRQKAGLTPRQDGRLK